MQNLKWDGSDHMGKGVYDLKSWTPFWKDVDQKLANGQSLFSEVPKEMKSKPWGQFHRTVTDTRQDMTFMRIYEAGHMVPMDQPPVALYPSKMSKKHGISSVDGKQVRTNDGRRPKGHLPSFEHTCFPSIDDISPIV